MVVASRPVYYDITHPCDQTTCRIDTATRWHLAEIKETWESRAIRDLVDFEDGAQLGVHDEAIPHFYLGGEGEWLYDILLEDNPGFQVLDVVGMVVGGHFLEGGILGPDNFHLGQQPIWLIEKVRELYPCWFHEMFLAKHNIPNFLPIDVCDFLIH